MTWDYLFIGAGPASLLAATLLSRKRHCNVLILEAGGSLALRGCPGLREATCMECSGSDCRVTMGVGGSSAGFGNKLCHLPASSGVLSLIPAELESTVEGALKEWIGAETELGRGVATLPSSVIQRKFYSADTWFRKEYASLLRRLLSAQSDRVELWQNTAVRDVRKVLGGFVLRLDNEQTVETSNLILGTGRAGHRFLSKTLTSLGVGCNENHADVGIRLEASDRFFNGEFFYQDDPKFKFQHGTLGSSRTFCACRGGRIVPVKFGTGFFADGAFVNAATGVTNVALMVRAREVLTTEQIDDWCRAVNLRAGRALLLNELTMKNGKLSPADVLDSVPLWPSPTHGSLMAELLNSVLGGRHVHMFDQASGEGTVRIYGPAVDLYWPSPALSPGFRTEIDGLSIIGDAAGVSRGIVQALVSGAAWALVEAARMDLYGPVGSTQPDSAAA